MKIKYSKQILAIGLFLFIGIVLRGAHASAATLTVTNTNDTGAESFRQAVLDANNNAGTDTINFSIPGSGPHVINTATSIIITDGDLLVDGLSQSGSVCNSNAIQPKIVLNYQYPTDVGLYITYTANNEPIEVNGIAFQNGVFGLGSENVMVRCNTFGTIDAQTPSGEAMLRTDSNNISIEQNVFAVSRTDTSPMFLLDFMYSGGTKNNETLTGNYFGTDPTGAYNLISNPNADTYGVWVGADSEEFVIGGEADADKNVFRDLDAAVYMNGASTGSVSVLGNVFVDNGVPILTELKEPIIRSVQAGNSSTEVSVELDASLEPGTYRLEFFTNPTRRNNSFMPFIGDPHGLETMHGINAVSIAGVATVTKTSTDTETFTANISGTGYQNLTVTATLDENGNFGRTTALGYSLPSDSNLTVGVETNVGDDRCYAAGSTGAWSITVTNRGTQTDHEFGVLFNTGTSPESLFDLGTMSASGTASWQSYFGVYSGSTNSGQMAMLFWEGDLEPGQHVTITAPVDYGQTQVITQALNIVSQMPASTFSGTNVSQIIMDHVEQHYVGVAVNCDYAADMSVTADLTDPGITPGGAGTYVATITNHGPQTVAPLGQPTTIQSIGLSSYALVMGVPRHATVESIQVNGQTPCSYLTPESLGADPQTIDLSNCSVVCLDYGLMSSGVLNGAIAASPYSALVVCFSWQQLDVGASAEARLTVQSDSGIDDTAQLGLHVLRFGSAFSSNPAAAPFDVDTAYMVYELGIRANIENDSSIVYNPLYWLGIPTNNNANYIGLNAASSGVGGGAGGTLSAAGQPVRIAVEALAAIALTAAIVLLRRHFAYRVTH